MLTQQENPDIETSSEDYARRFVGPVGDYFLRVQEQLCLELLRPWAGCCVLDVGGGHAQIAIPLTEAGYKVTVVGSNDSCNDRLSRLARERSLNIPFFVGDLLNLPLSDRSFDVVISLRLISHVVSWKGLVRELTRVAKEAVLIDYPSLLSFNLAVPLLFRLKKLVERNTRPFLCFTRRQVSDAFWECGFDVSATKPEFFIPMALHRALKRSDFTEHSEQLIANVGATRLFGSPILALAEPKRVR
jgi:SAM-dependent methyltransferase